MSTSAAERIALATEVTFGSDDMTVILADGRKLSIPLAWFPRLAKASSAALSNYQLLGDGEGIHWPDLDEDISVDGLLR